MKFAEESKMKKKLTTICLLMALLALAGCGKQQAQQPDVSPVGTEQTTAAPEPSATPDPNAEKAYQEAMRAYETVMEQNCDIIYNGYDTENDSPFVSSGVIELSSMPRAELLQYLGYAFEDVSGDGVPELIIGTIPNENAEVPEIQLLLGGYACRDGEPVCFLEGWARNVYEWLGGGRFFNYGSGGYAYSGFGTFRLAEDDTELSCEEWYFSDTKGADDSEIGYYHNQTGVWDKNAAEELDIDADAFWALSNKFDAEIKTMELTPFAEYPYTSFRVTEKTAYEAVSNYCHKMYDWSIAEDNIMYVTPGEETESEYQVIFRSYTGAFVYFYVDKASGNTRLVEYVPTLEIEEEAGSINIFDYLG